eukprot:1080928-Rhodomonas_salina.1
MRYAEALPKQQGSRLAARGGGANALPVQVEASRARRGFAEARVLPRPQRGGWLRDLAEV